MNIPAKLNRLIGQAMHAYSMLDDGDRILVAVSGGIDSLVLAVLLQEWSKKAPIDYELEIVHINMKQQSSPVNRIRRQLAKHDLSVESVEQIMPADNGLTGSKNICFQCSRNRRTRLFSLAREKGCNKLALGHHKDDLIETFFINILYSGNISTMVPAQSLFNGHLTIIRPLAYLDKKEVQELADNFRLSPAATGCPLEVNTRRDTVRNMLENLLFRDPAIKENIFNALGNVREDYLLK